MSHRYVHIVLAAALMTPAFAWGQETPASAPAHPATHAASGPATTSAPAVDGSVPNVPMPDAFLNASGQRGDDHPNPLTTMSAYVLIILVLGVAAIFFIKRVLPRLTVPMGRAGKKIRVLETASLGPRKSLHLVQVGDRTFLLCSSADQTRMLADVTDSFVEGDAEPEGKTE